MNRKEHFSRWIAFGALAMFVCLVGRSLWLGLELRQGLHDLETAATDSIQWTLSQAEVDHLKYYSAVLEVESVDDLDHLRQQFDIYYSRIKTYLESDLYVELQHVETGVLLARLNDGLTAQVPLIDASDDVLFDRLPQLTELILKNTFEVREIALEGVKLQAEITSHQRIQLHLLFAHLSVVLAILVVSLSAAILVLISLFRRGQNLTEQTVQDAERMQTMISASLDAIILADEFGKVWAFNAAAEEIFGYAQSDALGIELSELVYEGETPPRDVVGWLFTKERSATREDGRLRLTGHRPNGDSFPVEVSLSASRSAEKGETTVWVAYVRDISQRLKSEEELRRARDDAMAGERAKDQLLTVMSHEMRTPLNGIIGSLDLLDKHPQTKENQVYLSAMRVSGDLLMQHVNDVLQLSRLKAQAPTEEPQAFDLSQLVQDLVISQQANALVNKNEISVYCHLGPDDFVHGQKVSIQKVLLNLIGNALKFTHDGAISVDVLRQGQQVEMTVADTGQGIAKDDLARIFDDFVTLDGSYGRIQEGTGLGLAIVKGLVADMGGDIQCDSALGEGSTFTVTLPLRAVSGTQKSDIEKTVNDRPEVSPDLALDTQSRQHRILVVEDNDINRLLLSQMLRDLGCEVVEASGGGQGLSLLHEQRFDLVLTDISMPDVDGITLLHEARDLELAPDTDIVAVTAHAAETERNRIKAAGFADVLTKPVHQGALSDVISRHIKMEPNNQHKRAEPSGNDQITDEITVADTDDAIQDFIARLGTDKAHDFLKALCQETEQFLIALHNASEATQSLRQEAHRLAGSAAILGLSDLYSELLKIEMMNKTDFLDVKRVSSAWKKAFARLSSFTS